MVSKWGNREDIAKRYIGDGDDSGKVGTRVRG